MSVLIKAILLGIFTAFSLPSVASPNDAFLDDETRAQLQQLRTQVKAIEDKAAEEAARAAADTKAKQTSFENANRQLSENAGNAAAAVADAFGLKPGSDVAKLQSGELRLLGSDVDKAGQHAEEAARNVRDAAVEVAQKAAKEAERVSNQAKNEWKKLKKKGFRL